LRITGTAVGLDPILIEKPGLDGISLTRIVQLKRYTILSLNAFPQNLCDTLFSFISHLYLRSVCRDSTR
jgi:hypothetical protein